MPYNCILGKLITKMMINYEGFRAFQINYWWRGAASLIHDDNVSGISCLHCGSFGIIVDRRILPNQMHTKFFSWKPQSDERFMENDACV